MAIFSKKHLTQAVIALLFAAPALAQVNGGLGPYAFLRLAPSARATALGASLPMVADDDPGQALQNPALLNARMHKRLTAQQQFGVGGVRNGYAGYVHDLPALLATAHIGLRYMGYGDIPMTDEFGNKTGTIQAGEWSVTAGAARRLSERFSLGANVTFAGSRFDEYASTALGTDVGLLYADTAHRFTAALVLKNAAAQLSTYAGKRESIPYDIQLGISKRLRYLPFRFGMVAHHLHRWDIRYDDPNLAEENIFIFGEEPQEKKGLPVVDNLFRHLIFNGEFLLGGAAESFKIRFGYNHLRKRELSVANYRSLAGFSGGIGFGIRRFRVDVGYGAWHLAGGNFHMGVGMGF